MKHVTMTTGLQESDIRPAPLMTEFMRLSSIDAHIYFRAPNRLIEVPCPACGSERREGAFRKNEFLYCHCLECASLFVSPRPTREALVDYYENSSASRYRVEHFAKETAKERRKHMLNSYAMWLGRMVDEIGNPEARAYADVHTQSAQIFEAIRELGLFDTLYSLYPLAALDEDCAKAGAQVARGVLSGLGAVSMLGQLENRGSPLDYLIWIRGLMADHGVITISTRTVSGFDMQVLWDKAPYVFVPEHLNLMSVEGLSALIARSGFELVELSTPGQLDLEFVHNTAAYDPAVELPRHVKYLLEQRGSEAHADFQEFLQKHRLSSHVRIAAVKPAASPVEQGVQ